MKKEIIKIHLTAILLVISAQFVYSQQNILYFMNGIHQSGELNPAYQNPCKVFVAAPLLSNLNLNITNTGFTYNDFIRPGTGLQKDSLIMDMDNIKGKLAKNNYFKPEFNITFLGLGFWAEDYYLTLSISNRTKSYFAYSDDIASLSEGNGNNIGEDNPLTLSNIGPHAINYTEIALGVSKQLTEKLTIGGKMKILMGTGALSTQTTNIELYTAEVEENYAMRLETDIEVNASGPFVFKRKADNTIEDIEFDDAELKSKLFSTKNMGLAIDVGATYQLNDEIKLYGSVTDFGFISWKSDTYNFYQNGTFHFEGVDIDLVEDENNNKLFEQITDSISGFFKLKEKDSPKFKTGVNPNIYLGGTYEVTKGINIGLLSKTMFYNKKPHQGVVLSANFNPVKWFTGAISYSIMNRSYTNIGLGLGLKLGGFQFYMLTDYINSIRVKNTKSLGLQFGLNLYFGCKNNDNKPEYEENEEL